MKPSEMWEGPNSSLQQAYEEVRERELADKLKRMELLGTILDGDLSEPRRLQVVEQMKVLHKQIKKLKK